MKNSWFISRSTALALAACFTTTVALAQGSLTPPAGPPAPTMKSLDQVEARTPVNTLPGDATAVHIITLPGSYYLTGSITGNTSKAGIRIEAVNVTLDLNGYTIEAAVGSTDGINSNAPGGALVIRNGMIRGYTKGIKISSSTQFHLQDLQVFGSLTAGLDVDGKGTMERVSVMNSTVNGILASATSRVQIRDCRVDGVSNCTAGISAALGDIKGCSVSTLTGGHPIGISCTSGTVDSCTVRGIDGTSTSEGTIGIHAATISRCNVADISSTGLSVGITGTGISGSGTVAVDTKISDITAGGSAIGITVVHRVENCTVSTISGGTVSAAGITYCDEVLNSRISGIAQDSNNTIGIDLPSHGRAVGNRLTGTGSAAIRVAAFGLVENNRISGGNTGILTDATVQGVRIEGNHLSQLSTGIVAMHVTSVVVRNTAASTSTEFTVHAGVTVVDSTAIGTNPYANIKQ